MILRVVITEQAEHEMRTAFEWWAEHRSKRQAERWYAGLAKAIADLSENPQRHGQSREADRFAYEIRGLLFGLGRRPTHRAVFTIRGEEVVVLTVRHLAQQDLSPDGIAKLITALN
ncbi:MAG: type II toxin-antitoxin system RelE/ParE family toxin [Deltaproteobacteria bacterium]|nr:type II toxin-antitoxin system RelE/ParE family toxin [Planctomycetota bacterium]MBI3758447.1 type II toxin-antitoxin system RelE/ParE family toxin [Deltaproteobacteria bacterium]